MGISLETRAFESAIASALKDFEEEGEKYIEDTAEQIASDARSRAPVGATGELRDSISVGSRGSDSHGHYVEVGAHVPYAMFVEYGTYKDRAQPFMRPAMARAGKK